MSDNFDVDDRVFVATQLRLIRAYHSGIDSPATISAVKKAPLSVLHRRIEDTFQDIDALKTRFNGGAIASVIEAWFDAHQLDSRRVTFLKDHMERVWGLKMPVPTKNDLRPIANLDALCNGFQLRRLSKRFKGTSGYKADSTSAYDALLDAETHIMCGESGYMRAKRLHAVHAKKAAEIDAALEAQNRQAAIDGQNQQAAIAAQNDRVAALEATLNEMRTHVDSAANVQVTLEAALAEKDAALKTAQMQLRLNNLDMTPAQQLPSDVDLEVAMADADADVPM
ncbi:hypothetical protein KIPB_010999 [Kipferlia bialata]|uniref:Uncharacterized protein n=1 Tax=Kipferlia bialata TaxID=797122 RepID=A0A9K3D6P7_9EUKA|nr:hypothetical protein KIPB_010999 [Kipferlia bialata]|eukprot:g10999.t1